MAEQNSDHVMRVSNTSSPQQLGSAISWAVLDSKKVVLRAIGAGAVNQASKAIAIASGFAAQRGLALVAAHGFETIEINGEKVTAMIFRVFALH